VLDTGLMSKILFTCTKREMLAIEVAAGSSLFNVVVDTDETANKVLNMYVFTNISIYRTFIKFTRRRRG